MALESKNITLGSGEVFIKAFTSATDVPADINAVEAICVEANRLGHVKDGCTVSYEPSYYTAKDDLNMVSKTIITEEKTTFKTGIITFVPTTLEKLAQTGKATTTAATTSAEGLDLFELGGLTNYNAKKWVTVFKHFEGSKYCVMVCEPEKGFDFDFKKDAETKIDCEFNCCPELPDIAGTGAKRTLRFMEVLPKLPTP